METREQRAVAAVTAGSGKLGLKKRTISNRFRYRSGADTGRLSLDDFNQVREVDAAARVLSVDGLATYQSIVDATLPHGLMPTVTPELRHITLGGATVGIGIESTCFRHGFVHDGLLEAEVLCPDGHLLTCTPDNEYADLFHALPNSYGTLGYILRARLRLVPARPYVHITPRHYDNPGAFLDAMAAATTGAGVDFVEGLMFSSGRLLLLTARFADEVPYTHDIVRRHIFYRLVQETGDVYLRTPDYLFRYDPEWFWNLPDTPLYHWFRRHAPAAMRQSGFYSRYSAAMNRLRRRLPWTGEPATEPLIQDWQVPWEEAEGLAALALDSVDLDGKPWAAVPIRTPATPTLYPVAADKLYFNLGCYTQVTRRPGSLAFDDTRRLDADCFARGGIKMLYSSTFLDRDEFDRRYNGEAYAALKQKYDPSGRAFTLYDKTVLGR